MQRRVRLNGIAAWDRSALGRGECYGAGRGAGAIFCYAVMFSTHSPSPIFTSYIFRNLFASILKRSRGSIGHGTGPMIRRGSGARPYRIRAGRGISQRGETTSWHKVGGGWGWILNNQIVVGVGIMQPCFQGVNGHMVYGEIARGHTHNK